MLNIHYFGRDVWQYSMNGVVTRCSKTYPPLQNHVNLKVPAIDTTGKG